MVPDDVEHREREAEDKRKREKEALSKMFQAKHEGR